MAGSVAQGFEDVRREFERNFAERNELGAACAAYVGGEKVVDLWRGVRDARSGERWSEDTLVLLYSTSKGLAAMTLALAHSRGWLDYDKRVASYWPEFAQEGKSQNPGLEGASADTGATASSGIREPAARSRSRTLTAGSLSRMS
jgi:CubicO group peptidase (beta-lactamase class C family)